VLCYLVAALSSALIALPERHSFSDAEKMQESIYEEGGCCLILDQPRSEPGVQLLLPDLAHSQSEYDDNIDLEKLWDVEKDANEEFYDPSNGAEENWNRLLYGTARELSFMQG